MENKKTVGTLTNEQYWSLKSTIALIDPHLRYETGISQATDGTIRLRVSAVYETAHVLVAVHTWIGMDQVVFSSNCTEIDIDAVKNTRAIQAIRRAYESIKEITR